VKIVKGQDWPKKAKGLWVFPLEFPVGLGKMMTTKLKMTKLIHGKEKVVVLVSGIHKEVRESAAGSSGGVIYGYFVDKAPVGHCEPLVEEHNNIEFCIHCCHDWKYVSKIMLKNGMVEMVQDHPT
jgi:hypothetical protein